MKNKLPLIPQSLRALVFIHRETIFVIGRLRTRLRSEFISLFPTLGQNHVRAKETNRLVLPVA